jgi:hypothetical protein
VIIGQDRARKGVLGQARPSVRTLELKLTQGRSVGIAFTHRGPKTRLPVQDTLESGNETIKLQVFEDGGRLTIGPCEASGPGTACRVNVIEE